MRFAGSQLSNFMDPTNFDAISHSFMEGQARENISVNNAYGKRDMGQIEADLLRDKGEIEAKVIKARGQAQSAANWGAGISGLAQGIGGGLASMESKPGLGNTGNTVYGLGGGAGQGQLTAPLSTGDNALGLLGSFLGR